MLPGWPLVLILQVTPAPQTPPVLAKVGGSVLLVRGTRDELHLHQGSGVVVAPNLVATNAHVVAGAQGITVSLGQATWPATDVRMNADRDLCLLTVPGLTAPPVELAPEPAGPGQAVVAVGYPGGHGPVATMGRLRGIWHHEGGRLLQSDAPTLPGSSGGGLFDDAGRLLGLTTRTFTTSPRLNFSLPASWIEAQRLEGPAGAETRSGAGPEWQDADLMERLSADPRNWPAWEAAARQWVEDLPGDAEAWLALGLALDCSARSAAERDPAALPDQLQEAVEAYRRALSLRRHAKTWNNLGVALDLLNRFEEAEQAFGEALALEPGYAKAWLNLGGARFNARRFSGAAEAFLKGLAFRPDEAEAWSRLAHCQRVLGQREAATTSLQIALRHRPLAAELWLDLGLLLVEQARLEEARGVHTRLIDLNPEGAARLQAALTRVLSPSKGTRPAKPSRRAAAVAGR